MHNYISVLTSSSHNELFSIYYGENSYLENMMNYLLDQNMVLIPILMRPTSFVFVVFVFASAAGGFCPFN